MATRSYIGVQNKDGSVDYCYCHWDGYPEYVGRHVSKLTAVESRSLISQGDLSEVDKAPGRGYREPDSVHSMEEYMSILQSGPCEYAYVLFLNGNWMYADKNHTKFYQLQLALDRLKG